MLISPVRNPDSYTTARQLISDPRLIMSWGSWHFYAHGFWLDVLGAITLAVSLGLFTWLVLGGFRMIIRRLSRATRRIPQLRDEYRAGREERDLAESPPGFWDPADSESEHSFPGR